MEKVDITIAGAGVIGLAIAARLSQGHQNTLVIEKNASFGEEISSRNSEVIHAGIYYPKDSLKTSTCIEGRLLLYAFCLENNIAHKKIGKLIVAIDTNEVRDLEKLFRQGLDNTVTDLRLLSKEEVRRIEPHIQCEAAIYSPSTGIMDTHSIMRRLASQFESHNGTIAYNTELIGIDKTKDGFIVTVEDKREEVFKFFTRILINCAGLNSDKIAGIAGLKKNEYRLKYCKGDYFRVRAGKAKFISKLIYPVPKEPRAGLGIHATLDLSGGLRLGPDDEYVEKIDYNVDIAKREIFYENTRKFLPFIEPQDISPDTAGIRPKLQGPGEHFRDFIIQDEAESGLPGFINLIGIESPGFTSALSIAKAVYTLLLNSALFSGKIIN